MYASAPSPSALVGRGRELAILNQRFAAACAGNGTLALIGGEAGIGKTALAEALCCEAAEQGAFVLAGRCYDLTETPAYGPWLSLFERYHPDHDLPNAPPAFAHPGIVGDVASQLALFRQILDFVVALSARHPTVLLLDDLHWSDPASLDALRFLAQSIATVRVLILITFRSDELTRSQPLYHLLPHLVREAHAERLELHPLDDAATQQLMRARYSLSKADTDRLVRYLHVRAEGNALFAGELLRSLEEARVLRQDGGAWSLGALTQTTVPPLLRQIIDGRLARLGERSQRLLPIAAVIGQEVPLGIWAAVGECDDDTVLDVAEQGIQAGLLREAPDGDGVLFTHALIREAIYGSMPAVRRRRVHRQVGHALAATPRPNPDAVAYQFAQADDLQAVAWLIAAGERAQRSYAWLTAAERYENALTMMERDDVQPAERGWLLYRLAFLRTFSDPEQNVAYLDEALHLAERVGDRALAAITRFARGTTRVLTRRETVRGMAEAIDGANAVEALSPEERSYLSAQLRAGQLSLADLPNFRWGVIRNLTFLGRLREALTIGEHESAETEQVTDWHRSWGMAMTYALLGRPVEAAREFDRARTFAQRIGHYHQTGWIIYYELMQLQLTYFPQQVEKRQRLAAVGEAAWQRAGDVQADVLPRWPQLPLLLLQGEWSEAWEIAQVARGYTLIFHREVALSLLGLLAWWQGEPDLAWETIREMFPDGPETAPGGVSFYEALILLRVAAALSLDANDDSSVRTWLEAYDRYLGWSGAVLGQSEGQLLWAQYYRAIGDAGRAAPHANRALAHATEPRQPLAYLAAHRLLGELDTEAGRFEGARTHLDTALAVAEACAIPHERALTLLALAELHAATGKRTAAGLVLDDIRAICAPLGARRALMRADVLATRLAESTVAPPAYPAGLSAREVEVLRMIAAGRSNRAIADALFLSANTVRIHVTHILEKTNTDNRAAAAAFAQRHGLT